MRTINGIVEDVWTKTVNTKRGAAEVVWARVAGEDVNCGFKSRAPQLEQGQYVAMNVEENKYRQLEFKGLGQAQTGAAPKAVTTPASGPTARTDFPVPKTDKGMSICRQSSLKAAIDAANSLMRNGHLSMDDYESYVVKMTLMFTDLVTGQNDEFFLKYYNSEESVDVTE